MSRTGMSRFWLICSAGLVILLWSSVVNAEDLICFDKATANRLYRAIEEKSVLERQVDTLEAQVQMLEKKIEALDELVKSQQATIKQMDRLLTDERTRCKQAIKQARPSFFDELKKAMGYTGLGVVIGAALFAL